MSNGIRIRETRIDKFTLANQDPTWRFALGGGATSELVLIELHAESGNVGRGVAKGIPHIGHTHEQVQAKIPELLAAVEEAGTIDPDGLAPFLQMLKSIGSDCGPALAGVEMAVYDLVGRELDKPVYQLLGGAFRRSATVLRILSLKEPEAVGAHAKSLQDEGYNAFKIKLDFESLDIDVARVIAVREAVGPSAQLTLDANQSHTAESAIELCQRTVQCNIDIFEQPVPADDFEGLRKVKQSPDVTCAVEADEACSTVERVLELLCMDAVDSVSLKLPRLGGISAARQVARLCEVAGVSCRIGAHSGSRQLNAAALHTMASIPNIGYASELGEFARQNGDAFAGLEVQNGEVHLSDAAGLGLTYSSDQHA